MTQQVYGVIHTDSEWRPLVVPDGADVDLESPYAWFMFDDDAIWMEAVKLNTDDYWVGHFFYNDMEGPEGACPQYFNTLEHLVAHEETNNSSDHYDCTSYEHIVDGVVVEVINHPYVDHYSND